MGGRAISLGGKPGVGGEEGKGVSCVVPAGLWDGCARDGMAIGASGREERLERRELSHSGVATFLAGLVGTSRHRRQAPR